MKIFTIAIVAFSLNALAHFSAHGAVMACYQDGDELSANPTAQSDSICPGQSTQLFALPSGGGSSYTFSWASDPPGFSSSLADPMVTPLVTTVYTVTVNDGSGSTSGNVTIYVKPLPEINLLPDNPNVRILNQTEISICVFDSITIDAGNPGAAYLWNTGASSRMVKAQTSGISYDEQKFEVLVTDPVTGCSNNASLNVHFSFSDCSYGLEEKTLPERLSVYPNPSSDGLFTCTFERTGNDVNIEVYTALGTIIKQEMIRLDNSGRYTTTIDLSTQIPGVYFLRASDNKSVMQHKMIIRR